MPTKNELNVLFNNRAAIGGFNASIYGSEGWYWSSTEAGNIALMQTFSDGYPAWFGKGLPSSLRSCVVCSSSVRG